MVSVLFVRPHSVYYTMPVDCWDKKRDALNWPGGNSVIAHPPCAQWGKLSGLANKNKAEKDLAIWAVHQVRQWGGILEHPRSSKLWQAMKLPAPGNVDQYGGFSICIDQHWFGHKAKKSTLLYISRNKGKRTTCSAATI